MPALPPIPDLPQNLRKGARIAVAMSGGVDSSVVAGWLHGAGFEVVGVTLMLEGFLDSCCSIHDAKRVCASLDNIPHHVIEHTAAFRAEVINPFLAAYAVGETPNPCVRCNRVIKFSAMLDACERLGCDAMATGHYARILHGEDGPQLHMGADMRRDQSYFLSSIARESLGRILFPIGSLSKTETRALAETLALPVAKKPDSQDLCFSGGLSFRDYMTQNLPESVRPGPILAMDGRELGLHEGIAFYTVGQRRGLGVASDAPLFVVEIDAARNAIIVGPKEALAKSIVPLAEINLLLPEKPSAPLTGSGKLRSAQAQAPCTLTLGDGDTATLAFDAPQYGVSPGQAGVFYQGTRVIAGGKIEKSA
ncbi:MAG TPA: tRNA 2-thiouridine(34) synthase MnmA [Rhodospirillaceae bacterium]|nr:MAG: tRNA 2-thiouridine(34) synthase MnmA [Alphaproteobacteria bacterium GWF2_58_20]HAU29129.1 tRNA 2-thiouridine(34) synthase MnmA [Rhodospirillaceae bacterium]